MDNMPSSGKTEFAGLNVWDLKDKVAASDFNRDNEIIDEYLQQFGEAIADKADKTALESLKNEVDGKASQSSLSAVQAGLDDKASKSDLASVKSTAETAQSTANTAKTTAEAAQSTANAKANKTTEATTTLTAAGWSGAGPYTQTVTVSGVTASNTFLFDVAANATVDQATAFYEALIGSTGQGANSVTLRAVGVKPGINIPVKFAVLG